MLRKQLGNPLKPDDHSELEPLLPIPNRTVKRLCADDSADSRVKVGHRQATCSKKSAPSLGALFFGLWVCAELRQPQAAGISPSSAIDRERPWV